MGIFNSKGQLIKCGVWTVDYVMKMNYYALMHSFKKFQKTFLLRFLNLVLFENRHRFFAWEIVRIKTTRPKIRAESSKWNWKTSFWWNTKLSLWIDWKAKSEDFWKKTNVIQLLFLWNTGFTFTCLPLMERGC